MKAVAYTLAGPIDRPDAFIDIVSDAPEPGARDILVRVKAVSVNPVDTKVRSAVSPTTGHPRVLGFDAAGTVEAVGEDVTLFKVGDDVFYAGDITRPGTNAEFHVVDERIVGRKPDTLDWAQAAAMPLTTLTAWELLFDRLRVQRDDQENGKTILIVNGAGGVGSILIQLARRLTNLRVVATASRPETIEWCLKLGAHDVIDHRRPLDEALKQIGIDTVEYIASLSSSEANLPVYAEIIAPQGRLALIDDPKTFDIVRLKRKAVTVSWEGMFTRSTFKTPDMVRQHEILNEVAKLVEEDVIRSTLGNVLEPINAANMIVGHAQVESGRSIGKVVLSGFGPVE